MNQRIIIYGYGDKSDLGLKTGKDIQQYLKSDIFKYHQGRHYYTQTKKADIIVVSQDGLAYGHMIVDDILEPTKHDIQVYPKTKKVYQISVATVYGQPVRLMDLNIHVRNFGTLIDHKQFKKIINKAGQIIEYPKNRNKLDKISRICWNTKEWKFPSDSRDKSSSSGSFESKYGYGHEEWLFDRSRIINEFHYAFLQTLHLKTNIHVGNIYNIHLIAINNKVKRYVGYIRNVECISKNESQKIYKIYRKNGWIKEMILDIEKAGAKADHFKNINPSEFVNIKFRFDDVFISEEFKIIADNDENVTTHRYKLLPKKSDFNLITVPFEKDSEGRFKNTSIRHRTFNIDSQYDPYHDKIQNALCSLLRNNYKDIYRKVDIEKERIDIKAQTFGGDWHYFEIKTDTTRLSIRSAIGQLMEYSYWPDTIKAKKLFIVSDRQPEELAIKYLSHIRNRFHLPVFYRYFNLQKKFLSDEY